MESIKFAGVTYDLVANGYQLDTAGGKLVFLPGAATFAEIQADVKSTKEITLLDGTGAVIKVRSDLVYAGRMSLDENYLIGTEQVEAGVDDAGDQVYEQRDITGSVVIVEFRQPDLRERCAELEAKLSYLAMMTDVEMEV